MVLDQSVRDVCSNDPCWVRRSYRDADYLRICWGVFCDREDQEGMEVNDIITGFNAILATHLIINLGAPVLSLKAIGIGVAISVILSIIHYSTKPTQ